MKIRIDHLFCGTITFILLVVSLTMMQKGLFVTAGDTRIDGFYSQMLPFMDGIDFSSLGQLKYIHFTRFLVVYPFFIGDEYNLGGWYYSVIILMFSLPILNATKRQNFNFIKYLILIVPVFVSYRAFLASCSIAYLFIAIFHHKNKYLILMSLFISVLSSAVMMVWLLIIMINLQAIRKQYRLLFYLLIALAVFAFLPSVLNKKAYAVQELSGIFDYILRGTIVVSYLQEQWGRLVIYVVILIGTSRIVIRVNRKDGYRLFHLSYLPFFVGALFEGLGLVCGVIVVLLYFTGFRPTYRTFSYKSQAIRGNHEVPQLKPF